MQNRHGPAPERCGFSTKKAVSPPHVPWKSCRKVLNLSKKFYILNPRLLVGSPRRQSCFQKPSSRFHNDIPKESRRGEPQKETLKVAKNERFAHLTFQPFNFSAYLCIRIQKYVFLKIAQL